MYNYNCSTIGLSGSFSFVKSSYFFSVFYIITELSRQLSSYRHVVKCKVNSVIVNNDGLQIPNSREWPISIWDTGCEHKMKIT